MGTLNYALFLLAIAVAHTIYKPRRRLPPGPKPLPLIGNAHQFPLKHPWETFAKWRKEYGDVVYANVLGKPILVLNSDKACVDLLDKRSANYSDRPRMVMFAELMCFDWEFALMPYSARWRQHRKLFHQFFNEGASQNYIPIQERSTHFLMRSLLAEPEKFLEHTRLTFSQVILETCYGIKVTSREDPYVKLVEETLIFAMEASVPGRYMADIFPFLKYVPGWVPGAASFQNDAAQGRVVAKNSKELPAKYVENNMHNGADVSVLGQMYTRCESEGENTDAVETPVDIAKNSVAAAYLAGADTTVSSVQALFMVLANYPEVLRKGQAEIDDLVGTDRLPTWSDIKDLPYIGAIAKELLRWHVVVPLAAAHCVTQDDEYEGYHIPKGTVVLPNIWHTLHDPEVYPEPSRFDPMRWVVEAPGGLEPSNKYPDPDASFGFGRRICPGRHFANNALLLAVASIVACFNIAPLDESGNPADKVSETFDGHFLLYPTPYKVSITPRSAKVVNLLKQMAM